MTRPEILRTVPLFSDLPDEDLERLATVSFSRVFEKDNIIFFERDKGDSLFIINSGRVKVAKFSKDGKEIILAILGVGEFFGDMSLLDGEPRSATVVAIEKTEVTAIRRSDFLSLMSENPKIAERLLAVLSTRLREANSKISNLALLDVYGRLARALSDIAKQEGRPIKDGWIAFHRPTHQAIANMIGTSRETVTRTLGELHRKGFIRLSGKEIAIRDRFQRDLEDEE